MKFLDILRKLGIFRSGSVSGTYANAVDRPTELQMDDVYDAKKDLTTKKDVEKIVAVGTISRALFLTSIIVGLFFFLMALTCSLGWLVFLLWLAWIGFILFIKIKKVKIVFRFWLVFSILVIVTLFMVLYTQTEPSNKSVGTKNGSEEIAGAGTPEESTFDCVFTAADSPEKIKGYEADVFSSERKDMEVGERRVPTKTTTFKRSDFTMENADKLKETVYFTVYGDKGQFIPGVLTVMQVCNSKTNKTALAGSVKDLVANPTTANTGGVEQDMSWVSILKQSGKYRVDGIMKVNGGEWKLVDRLEIEFK